MSYCITFPSLRHITVYKAFYVSGFGFVFSNGGIVLSPSDDVTNPLYLAALEVALSLHPLIVTSEALRVYIESTSWGHVSDDVLEEYLSYAVPLYIKRIMSLPVETFKFIEVTVAEVERRRKVKALAKSIHSLKPPAQALKLRPGYVYLIQASDGHYKIGRTKNPDDRIATFSVKLPMKVDYAHVIYCNDMVEVESELHRKFSLKRVDGEWFKLDEDDVEWIKALGDKVGRWLGETHIEAGMKSMRQ